MLKLLLVALMSLSLSAQSLPSPPGTPVPVIYLDDCAGDPDCSVNMAFLIRMQQLGYINIIAVLADSAMDGSVAYMRSSLVYAGLTSIPVGTQYPINPPLLYADVFAATSARILNLIPQPSGDGAFPSCISVLRAALAADTSDEVVVIETGFQQCMDGLLTSPADTISSSTGAQLITTHTTIAAILGGDYPGPATEFNFQHAAASSADVSTNWPKPIYYIGYTTGLTPTVGTGYSGLPSTNPFNVGFTVAGVTNRPCWDALIIMFGSIQFSGTWFSASSNGSNSINSSTGTNTWSSTPGTYARYYLSKAQSDANIQTVINNVINVNTLPE
jgi:hypothetical protein